MESEKKVTVTYDTADGTQTETYKPGAERFGYTLDDPAFPDFLKLYYGTTTILIPTALVRKLEMTL